MKHAPQADGARSSGRWSTPLRSTEPNPSEKNLLKESQNRSPSDGNTRSSSPPYNLTLNILQKPTSLPCHPSRLRKMSSGSFLSTTSKEKYFRQHSEIYTKHTTHEPRVHSKKHRRRRWDGCPFGARPPAPRRHHAPTNVSRQGDGPAGKARHPRRARQHPNT